MFISSNSVFILLRFLDEQEVGTRGLFGLDPDLPQADGGEFLSFQMENEYKRSPIVVRSWRDSQVVSEKGNVSEVI